MLIIEGVRTVGCGKGITINGEDFDEIKAHRDAGLIDIKRLTAERDGLQLLLNARDERVDLLEGLLEKMLKAIKRTYQAGRDRIIELGGDCDGVEIMMNGDLTVQEARTALKQAETESHDQ